MKVRDTHSSSSAVILPIDAGIEPMSEFMFRSSAVSKERAPREEGSEPLN